MGTDIKSRTLEFIKYNNISVKTFESRCGLSNGYVASMRKGFGTEKLKNVLSEFPNLNREWLLYGEGDMLITETLNTDTERIMRLVDTIATMQEVIDMKNDIIASQQERIQQLENQLKNR